MAKTLYFGGNILTMDKDADRAEALLTEDGYIKALGSSADLLETNEDAEKIDLGGKTLMPAFIDGHSHPAMYGSMLKKCYLGDCRSFDDILKTITDYIEKNDLTHGEKISCYGYDLARLKEGKHPTASLLDRLQVNNPIECLHVSFHMGSYNSIAMKMCGIDDTYQYTGKGVVGRDANGHLNGYFEEVARRVMSAFMAKGNSDSYEENYLAAEKIYLSHGITTIQDGGSINLERVEKYKKLAEEDRLCADVVLYLDARALGDIEKIRDLLNSDACKKHLKLGGVKVVLDGSPQAKTAWMREPYVGESDYRGYPMAKDERLYEILLKSTELGLQFIAHCNGDAAAEQFISAFERIVKDNPKAKELRPVMIHAQTVGYDQLDRMAKIGMIPSFFVGHCYYWGDTHLANFGQERGERISPIKATIDRGLKFNLHQDSPVTKPDMLHSVWCAVNRITSSGKTVGEENRISVYDALIGATCGGAYAYFEENRKGILKEGAIADLIILDSDPTDIDPMKIKDIKIVSTIKSGKTIFDSTKEVF